MNSVAAIVVTYNRKKLLAECISALLGSETKCDIIIIDNNSTDGTREYIDKLVGGRVTYKRLTKNVGGAGGFFVGMNYALKRGYEYIWIMDDDTIVKGDTLTKLVGAAGELHGKFGFLSSSVKWTDGSDCKMNIQSYKRDISAAEGRLLASGIIPVISATFVSLLIPADVIRDAGLPRREYFIWGDDKEYTRRLSKRYSCYNVTTSEVVHKMASNEGSNIAHDNIDRVDRYYYAYRNDFATARDEGTREIMIYIAGFVVNVIRILILSKDGKAKRLTVMLRGLRSGLSFRVPVRYPK